MNDNHFSNRLNNCLDQEGFPPKNRGRIQLLAEMMDMTHRGASKWINGQSIPPAKKMALLAERLKVNEIWLRTGAGEMRSLESLKGEQKELFIVDVPIYHIASILSGKKVIQKIIKCNLPCQGQFFGVVLDTEAMSPRFPKGSIIIFDSALAKDGDFVLVNCNGFPHPIFRQLLIMDEILYLHAHNPVFDRLVLSDTNRVVGKLIQAILYF